MRTLLRPILGGLRSYLPGADYRETGGSTSARYCYAVWARHLAVLRRHGAAGGVVGGHVAELGPGDTLGLSLAALLSGAEFATACDGLRHATPARNRQVFDELVALFAADAPLPGDDEFPDVRPRVPGLRALEQVVAPEVRAAASAPDRLAAIRADLDRADDDPGSTHLRYAAPWSPDAVDAGSLDLVVSQAVLEYLPADDGRGCRPLAEAFAAMHGWLKPGGVMSHQVDLSAPFGLEWNAHWAAGPLAWRLILGRRPHYENRVPLSGYLAACERAGFVVLAADTTPAAGGLGRDDVAPPFRELPDTDFAAASVHLIARKR